MSTSTQSFVNDDSARPKIDSSPARRFEDLEVWKAARILTRTIYKTTSGKAFLYDHALSGQLRRAAVSVMSNMAEGFERGGNREFLQFLAQAKGSCGEIRSHLHVALDQRYITNQEFESIVDAAQRISGMTSNLMKHLRKSEMRGTKFKQAPSP
jgi:four helix bundle protein